MMKAFLHISFESRISVLKRNFIRPVRDYIWVDTMDSPNALRAVRYNIYKSHGKQLIDNYDTQAKIHDQITKLKDSP